jgi:hypothetical protein
MQGYAADSLDLVKSRPRFSKSLPFLAKKVSKAQILTKFGEWLEYRLAFERKRKRAVGRHPQHTTFRAD